MKIMKNSPVARFGGTLKFEAPSKLKEGDLVCVPQLRCITVKEANGNVLVYAASVVNGDIYMQIPVYKFVDGLKIGKTYTAKYKIVNINNVQRKIIALY